MQQVAFYSVLYAVGLLLVSFSGPQIPHAFAHVSGFVWGLLLWVISCVFLLTFGIRLSLITSFAGVALILAAVCAVRGRQCVPTPGDLRRMACASLVFALCAVVFTSVNFSVASYDSFVLVELGRVVGYQGSVMDDLPAFGSWGCFLPIAHSVTPLIGIEYLHALLLALYLSHLACFYCLLRMAIEKLTGAPRGLLPTAATAALATIYFFVFQAFYIHNSFPGAVYLSLFVLLGWIALMERAEGWLWLSAFAAIGFAFQRLENPVLAVTFLGILFSCRAFSYRQHVLVATVVVLVLLPWNLRLGLAIVRADILTPAKSIGIVAYLSLFLVMVVLSRVRLVDWLWRHYPLLLVNAISLVILIFIYRHPKLMSTSFAAVVTNMMFTGRWGSAWFFMIPLLAFSPFLEKVRGERFLVGTIVSFFLILYALVYVRADNPYRLGFGCSANRMLTHIVPTIIFYLALKYGTSGWRTESVEPREWLWGRGCAACAIMVLISGWSQTTTPVDHARGGAVLQAPQWCMPPVTETRHDFGLALRGYDNEEYVAAASSGPAVVVVQMRSAVAADVLFVVGYPGQRFKDYAWDISLDGVHWNRVYDTRVDGVAGVRAIEPATTVFSLTGKGRFRYLRLTFRQGEGQNRLLLRRVSIYSRQDFSRVEGL